MTARDGRAAQSRRSLKPRHVPQRTCVACRTTAAKRGFVRLVRQPDGHVVVDPTGKANGRGAYLCAERRCWEVALQRGRLAQSLRVTIVEEDRAALAAYAGALRSDAAEEPPAQAGGSDALRRD